MQKKIKTAAAALLSALVMLGVLPQSAAALEKGDRVTIVVPYSPGGGFDTQARLVAPYVEQALRERGMDDVNVIVTNVRGGGGAIATSKVYTEKPDGTTLLVLDPESSLWQQSLAGAAFDIADFTYLGQLSADPFTLAVRKNLGIQSLDAAVKRSHGTPLLVATSGHGAIDQILPLIIQKVLSENGVDLKLDFLHFGGTSDKMASMRRNEAELTAASTTAIRKYVENGEVELIVSFSDDPDSPVPAPYAGKVLGLPAADYARLEAGASQRRVLVAPPGASAATTKLLRDAVEAALTNPELLQKAKQANQVIKFLSGARVNDSIQKEVDLARTYAAYLKQHIEK